MLNSTRNDSPTNHRRRSIKSQLFMLQVYTIQNISLKLFAHNDVIIFVMCFTCILYYIFNGLILITSMLYGY